ncbi:hypothetical protein KIW84_055887 [Lathyrus oleraceus]|uniref:Uncharacterized protein n=1 Tax=Pisum sativum TaxID=3888 RepID=A0A9D4WYZ4_PEA|nr:hypothetical protein KIW84_055887 [Pisum sativum]
MPSPANVPSFDFTPINFVFVIPPLPNSDSLNKDPGGSQSLISSKIEIGEDEVTVQSRWNEANDSLHHEEYTNESQMSQNMQVFNVIFHHEGEFVRLNNGDTIYRGDVSTIMYGQLIDKWSMVKIHKLEMWPGVQSEELLPPMYKKCPGRPRKLRIKNFGHNVQSCKSKKQDPNALKRKEKVKVDAGNVNQSGSKVGT